MLGGIGLKSVGVGMFFEEGSELSRSELWMKMSWDPKELTLVLLLLGSFRGRARRG